MNYQSQPDPAADTRGLRVAVVVVMSFVFLIWVIKCTGSDQTFRAPLTKTITLDKFSLISYSALNFPPVRQFLDLLVLTRPQAIRQPIKDQLSLYEVMAEVNFRSDTDSQTTLSGARPA